MWHRVSLVRTDLRLQGSKIRERVKALAVGYQKVTAVKLKSNMT
jgi:hypothetical protein